MRIGVLCWLMAVGITAALRLDAQSASNAAKPKSDVVILVDGEKLIGRVESATAATLLFKSDVLGEIKLEWSKVKELETAETFASIPKGVTLRGREDTRQVARGTLSEADQKVQVEGGANAPQTISTGDIGTIIPAADFDKALQHTGLLKGWKGGATAGLSITEATQNNRTFTAAVNLVRGVPSETWLSPSRRTIFDYTQAYGQLTQPGTPTAKTSLFHVDAEQDWYLSPRLFVFAEAAWDHSFSQGLQLQQNYGGGIGYLLLKDAKQELDVKASVNYIDQRFEGFTARKSLFGSIFGETYVRTFTHGILLNEQASFAPAWTSTNAYSSFASAALTFPVYHRLGFTVSALDNFLNDPPPGFRKNSFQFTLGATYSLK